MSSMFETSMFDILANVIIIGIPIVIAITLHEAAHGFVALRFGDDTALHMGRVTFNPIRHVDPLGTIIIPLLLILSKSGILFGYAKPVPVNFSNLNNPRRDMIFVAAAGPGTNLILAFISAVLLRGLMFFAEPNIEPSTLLATLMHAMEFSIYINCILAVFNMIPIPPLDGGRVAVGLLPDPLARPLASMEPYGIFILLGVLFLLPLVTPINLFMLIIFPIVKSLMAFFMGIVGIHLA